VLRFLLWRLLGLLAGFVGLTLISWFLDGGPGRVLRGSFTRDTIRGAVSAAASVVERGTLASWSWDHLAGVSPLKLLAALGAGLGVLVALVRWQARRRRHYVRLCVDPFRTDSSSAESLVTMFEVLHKRLLRRWWRRLLLGQPSVALEVHHTPLPQGSPQFVWLAVSCVEGLQRMVETSLQTAYPNCRVRPCDHPIETPPVVLRLKKRDEFIKRVKVIDHFEHDRQPQVNRLMTVLGACGDAAFVQMAVTPTPAFFERFAKRLFKSHEASLSRERRAHLLARDRSMVEDAELRGGLEVQHRPLFFVDLRVVASNRGVCERIASELRAEGAENRLIERGTAVRHGLLGLYSRRVRRGEGNPLPSFHKGVFAATELASMWHLPSIDYMTVPFARSGLPLAPAPPSILRPGHAAGTLRDALGAVSIHPDLRKQNTAVPGTVEQGKSSYLVATVAEDLRRERCAVIVLDPKGDAAESAVSLVPAGRTCTLLDFSRPTCGFSPLTVDAPADVIADYVVAALKNLFTDADIRASSDRYLRNAIIAVLAYDRESTLWDAARLLSVGEEGYSYRSRVGARVRTLPEFKEISQFFTAELTAQLADARSMTTAKLDAPVNKLARLLNSASIKRVLLNDSLTVDFDRVIAGEEVLVVKGALGAMGAGNTSVLMQLLVGMLDAALARQQDLVPAQRRVTVALKVDEAPLVLNRGFAETMALKRSAGLETVACWQSDAQWTDREIRDQLDALFAHRVYFATASTRDARAAVGLTMAEFSDTVRPGVGHLSKLGHPDVRLHLPKHHAIASWITPEGRQAPFIAQTIPLHIDQQRLALHAESQRERGGRHRTDLSQPHWDRKAPRLQGDQGDTQVLTGVTRVGAGGPADRGVGLPATPSDSYRELVELDGAHSVRWAKRVELPQSLEPDQLDLEILQLIADLRHVLTSQVHRRFNAGRAATTTQRRLKRLSDAGLVERFQFHRRDGGGVPMCYVITAAGRELLYANDRPKAPRDGEMDAIRLSSTAHRPEGETRLRQARHDVHVTGWALALEQAMGDTRLTLNGPGESVLSPPLRSTPGGRVGLGPGDLRLPGGRTAHDFLRTDAGGECVEVERFETVRPDAVLEVPANPRGDAGSDPTRPPAIDLIVELDDHRPIGRAASKLERYDHFLAGWSVHTRRYGSRMEAVPVVVFVCRDRARARECARRADAVLRACRAYAGEYPFDWEYPGRERILFASERDVHEGLLRAYGVPRLPPTVRVDAAHGDPRAREAETEPRALPCVSQLRA
jgi:Replication-relaxation